MAHMVMAHVVMAYLLKFEVPEADAVRESLIYIMA